MKRLVFPLALLLLASACGDQQLLSRKEVVGTVTRGTDEVVNTTFFLGSASAFSTLGGPRAYGFSNTSDGMLLTYIELHPVNWDAFAEPFPTEIPVGMASDISGRSTFGMGISYYERQGNSEEQIYHHMYNNSGGTSSGMFTIEDTDWSTYMEGQLVGVIDNSDDGHRAFDLHWRWEDHGDYE